MGRPKKNISYEIKPVLGSQYDKAEKNNLYSRQKDRLACIDYLDRHRVEVGLLDDASERSKKILKIQEAGSPIMNIPPRPVLQPALENSSTKWTINKHLELAAECAYKGYKRGMIDNLNAVGRVALNAVRSYIDSGIPPPNAPITKYGGWMRNPVSGKPVHIEGKGDKPPLVDTGQLRSEFRYKITVRASKK